MKKMVKSAAVAAALLASNAYAATIDIAVLYTDEAARKTGNINTKINQLISFSNQVYSQNGNNITLRLVGSSSIGNVSAQPTEGMLRSLTNSSSIQNYRNQTRADMVALLGTSQAVGDNSGLISCGIAWVGQGSNGRLYNSSSDLMYSITAVDCGATTFVHELGHNMGLAHSRKQGDTRGGVYVDGMGHGVQNVFASIMAYPHVFGSATQYDYFSNPKWSLGSYPYGVTGQSYAHKTVNAVRDQIASFK
ncbi:MAG: zinc-dependent metalloprotease family protein [Pseudomonadota bacterium]|nr:zinc-dependent metalloprotease family protein [Pseudomonadota bacterium]